MNWGLTSPSPSSALSLTEHIDGRHSKTRASKIESDRPLYGEKNSKVFLFVFLTVIEYNYAKKRRREGGGQGRRQEGEIWKQGWGGKDEKYKENEKRGGRRKHSS